MTSRGTTVSTTGLSASAGAFVPRTVGHSPPPSAPAYFFDAEPLQYLAAAVQRVGQAGVVYARHEQATLPRRGVCFAGIALPRFCCDRLREMVYSLPNINDLLPALQPVVWHDPRTGADVWRHPALEGVALGSGPTLKAAKRSAALSACHMMAAVGLLGGGRAGTAGGGLVEARPTQVTPKNSKHLCWPVNGTPRHR